jgi:hypothetical protein
MWSFMTQPGLATATVDFTSDLSLLLTGLVGVMWLSVGMTAFAAIRHYVSRQTKPLAETAPTPVDHREAA